MALQTRLRAVAKRPHLVASLILMMIQAMTTEASREETYPTLLLPAQQDTRARLTTLLDQVTLDPAIVHTLVATRRLPPTAKVKSLEITRMRKRTMIPARVALVLLMFQELVPMTLLIAHLTLFRLTSTTLLEHTHQALALLRPVLAVTVMATKIVVMMTVKMEAKLLIQAQVLSTQLMELPQPAREDLMEPLIRAVQVLLMLLAQAQLVLVLAMAMATVLQLQPATTLLSSRLRSQFLLAFPRTMAMTMIQELPKPRQMILVPGP